MTHGSLFSGIGGFDLAAEWARWENMFHCEWNEFGQKILNHYWPNAKSYGDITKTDFSIHRGTIDVLTGGFPCQPYSLAGKRKGKEDERHLWPEMLRAIREIQPRYVVGENVPGLISWNGGVVFDEVQTDLEACGYKVIPFILPACSVNAPHKRERVWVIAHSISNGYELRGLTNNRQSEGEGVIKQEKRQRFWDDNRGIGKQTIITNAKETECKSTSGTWTRGNGFTNVCDEVIIADSNGNIRCKRRLYQKERYVGSCNASDNKRSTWQDFPTQSPICGGDDGLPSKLDGITFSKWRNESIKAYGNAIVPQVAYQIFKAINEYEELARLK